MWSVPFVRLLERSPLPLQTVMLRDVLLFLPLGLLLGAAIRCIWPDWRLPAAIVAGGSIFAYCFVLEVLQALVPQRHPDITNVLMGGLAGSLGLTVLAGLGSGPPIESCARPAPSTKH
jgi:hypothetical protein